MRLGLGKKYYYIENGKVYLEIETNHVLDDERYNEGNYFLTKEEAKNKLIGGDTMKEKLVKSPLNYVGGKYKLLPQILPLFPEQIDIFVDVFGGGFNVGPNVNANRVIYNEYDSNVYNIIKGIKDSNDNVVEEIERVISQYELSKTNQAGYLALRGDWNTSERDWLRLYVLICYSFNNQIRFNSKGGYNMPFGKDRSSFNPTLKQKFIEFRDRVQSIPQLNLFNKDFRDILSSNKIDNKYFFYLDPPYLITTAAYNENGGWTEKDEEDLLSLLDKVDASGAKFALSNVIEHKGLTNDLLLQWSKKYKVHYLNYNYNNCNYQSKQTGKTVEVLITNY